MYSVSDKYIEAIRSMSRTTRIDGTLTLSNGTSQTLSDSDLLSGSLSINTSAVSGSDFQLGVAAMSELKVTIMSSENRYKMFGGKLSFTFYITLADGTEESVPLGIYRISSAERKGKSVNIIAYDSMVEFEKDFSTGTIGTPYDILKQTCQLCGVELGNTREEIDAMSAKDSDGMIIKLKTQDNQSFSTYRDVIATVAVTLGGFAYIDKLGKLKIKRFASDTVDIANSQITSRTICDYAKCYSGVSFNVLEDEYALGDTDNEVLQVTDCLLATGIDTTRKQLMQNIKDIVDDVNYKPAQITMTGDPSIELGDAFTFYDNDGVTQYKSYAMKLTWNYKGKQTVEGVGANPFLSTKSSNKSKGTTASMKNDIDNGKFRVAEYLSSSPYVVDSSMVYVYDSTVNVLGGTSSMVVGSIKINVQHPGTFKWKFYFGGEKLLFEGSQVITYTGYHTIPIFCVLTRLSELTPNTFAIAMTSEDGYGLVDENGVYLGIAFSGADNGDKKAFDGQVELKERIGIIPISEPNLEKFDAEVSVSVKTPTGTKISESIGEIAAVGIGIIGFEDSVSTTNS